MGDSPMWIEWHGRLARVSRAQTNAPSKHMGESPMPLDHNQFHGRVARATRPNRFSGSSWHPFRMQFLENIISGAVAPSSLNHRLQAIMPPA